MTICMYSCFGRNVSLHSDVRHSFTKRGELGKANLRESWFLISTFPVVSPPYSVWSTCVCVFVRFDKMLILHQSP